MSLSKTSPLASSLTLSCFSYASLSSLHVLICRFRSECRALTEAQIGPVESENQSRTHQNSTRCSRSKPAKFDKVTTHHPSLRVLPSTATRWRWQRQEVDQFIIILTSKPVILPCSFLSHTLSTNAGDSRAFE